jgi:hypothetical protein
VHNKVQSCYTCHLVSYFDPMSESSVSYVEHANSKRGYEGVCTEFPPHILGPVISMFQHRLFLDIVRYTSETVTAEKVVEFLMEPIPTERLDTKPMARLQYLLVMHIFASNGPVAFPTHRYDRKYRDNILAGSTPTPSTIRSPENESLLVKIEKKLSSPTPAAPSSSPTHFADNQPHASGRSQTQGIESNPPPSQNPTFSFANLEHTDPSIPSPSASKSRIQRGNLPPPSQDPGFRFDTGNVSLEDELVPPSQAWPSQQSSSRFDSSPQSQLMSDFSRPKSTGFRFGIEPGSSKQQAVLPDPLSGPSRRQGERSGLSKSTPSRSDRRAGPSILSRSTPGPSRPQSHVDALSSTPQTRAYSDSFTPSPLPSTVFRTPGLPASSVPATPTRTFHGGMPPSPLSGNSPLPTLPTIPPFTLRFNPYPPPLSLYGDGSKKGKLPAKDTLGSG